MSDLSEAFAEAQSNVITWNGMELHGLIEFATLPEFIKIRFRAAKSAPVQGLRFRATGAMLTVNGHDGGDFVLWHDRSPQDVDVRVRKIGGGEWSLKLWNVWRGGMDATQAWLGNAAIRIEGDVTASSFRMLCSDGVGEAAFDDLVADVEVA